MKIILVENCDMCDIQCLIVACGAAVVGCGAIGPGWLGCVLFACPGGLLLCCVLG